LSRNEPAKNGTVTDRAEFLSSKSGNEIRLAREKSENRLTTTDAHVAQLVERVLGKDEVTGSIPVMGSMS
jgi:hypothetical protein